MPRLLLLSVSFALVLVSASVMAARPSEELLPGTTKVFVAVPDMDVLREHWEETQLGQLVNDPVMQPFVEDFKRQIRSKLNQTEGRLGITWEDLEDAYGGEICVALLQPWDSDQERQAVEAAVAKAVADAEQAGRNRQQIEQIRVKAREDAHALQEKERLRQRATVMLVDVTGHADEASTLLEKIADDVLDRGGKKSTVTAAGVELVALTLPKEERQETARQAFYVIQQDRLVATDRQDVAAEVLQRMAASADGSLAEVMAFKTAMDRCGQAFGATPPHIRWFVEPFGYAEVARAYQGGRQRRGTDMLKVLANQGFTAVQGAGGFVALSTEGHELLHRTVIYAPPVERAAGDTSDEKYDLAARMLDFPNTPPHDPPVWAPRDLSMYLTFNWNTQNAFYASESLVNEVAGDEVFQDVLESIKTDPNGPQIDIERELIRFMGQRATLISDYRMPVTPKSERLLLALEVSDAGMVMETINKAMESDPAAKKRDYEGHVIWELLNEDPVEVQTLQIDGDFGFGFPEDIPEEEEEEKPFIPNSAITVAFGHLMVASHVDYIVDIFKQIDAPQQLNSAADFQLVRSALEQLGAGNDSFRFFTRTDEAYRVTYELVRQGKMPESESLLGKVLNRIWEPDEEGELREQQLDGSKMPEYQIVRRYLGPAGFYVQTNEDGWTVVGCVLTKDAE